MNYAAAQLQEARCPQCGALLAKNFLGGIQWCRRCKVEVEGRVSRSGKLVMTVLTKEDAAIHT
jgi:ribosomal protein L37AE/L43A